MQMVYKNKIGKIFRDFNNEILAELIPNSMKVPPKRMEFSMQNLSWLCRNLQINNRHHPEIKQTMAKLNTLRMKILLGKKDYEFLKCENIIQEGKYYDY